MSSLGTEMGLTTPSKHGEDKTLGRVNASLETAIPAIDHNLTTPGHPVAAVSAARPSIEGLSRARMLEGRFSSRAGPSLRHRHAGGRGGRRREPGGIVHVPGRILATLQRKFWDSNKVRTSTNILMMELLYECTVS